MTQSSIPGEDDALISETLDPLLRQLDSDPDRAREKYVEIRARLLQFFESKDCSGCERLVDASVLRVIKNKKRISAADDPDTVFQKAAKRILREYRKQWAGTTEAFERLLHWLHPDWEEAALLYNRIHNAMTLIFRNNRIDGAENLSDETIK